MNKEHLLKKLTILDFMSTDLCLYMDTHPEDKEALRKYNCVVKEAEKVRCEYEKHCGALVSYRSPLENGWDWIKCPWPWEEDFNFIMRGDR